MGRLIPAGTGAAIQRMKRVAKIRDAELEAARPRKRLSPTIRAKRLKVQPKRKNKGRLGKEAAFLSGLIIRN